MVGPWTAADRALNRRRLAAGLVGVVTLSAVLSALYSGASAVEIGLVGGVGAATGVALAVAMGVWP